MLAATAIARVVIGATLIAAGLTKSQTTAPAMRKIAFSELLRRVCRGKTSDPQRALAYARAAFVGTGALEALLGLWLVAAVASRIAALAVASFMACGVVYLVAAGKAAPAMSCGCSPHYEPTGRRSLVRAGAFLLAALLLAAPRTSSSTGGLALALATAGALLFVSARSLEAVGGWVLAAALGDRSRELLLHSDAWVAASAKEDRAGLLGGPREEWRVGRLLYIAVPFMNRPGSGRGNPSSIITLVGTVRTSLQAAGTVRVVEFVETEAGAFVRQAWTGASDVSKRHPAHVQLPYLSRLPTRGRRSHARGA